MLSLLTGRLCGLVFLIAIQQGDRRITGVPFGRVDLGADCHFRDRLDDDDDDDNDEEDENDEDDEDGAFSISSNRFSSLRETPLPRSSFRSLSLVSSFQFIRSRARTPF